MPTRRTSSRRSEDLPGRARNPRGGRGFVDIGDLVFNVAAGATFGYQLLWVVVVGVVGIIVYSEMCGRVAAISNKAVFDAVRERVGFGAGLATLVAAQIVNLMTLAAEIGGVAICLQL